MSKIIILGSASAIAYDGHENTHMVFVGQKHTILVDCVGSPVSRLREAGIRLSDVTDLFLTHFHPDHVSGVPLLLMDMWLLGRKKQLDIYGLHHTLTRTEQMMGFYEWETWPNFFPIIFHRLPSEAMTIALNNKEFLIHTAPVKHLIPTIGLRIEFCNEDFVAAYSGDTEPCPNVFTLASKANILIHEATGESQGHSSAAQAGEIAQRSGVDTLYLIHYSLNDKTSETLISEAQKNFSGQVVLTQDFMEIEIGG